MTADLTPTEVAALRERAEAATPGPWGNTRYIVTDPDGRHVCVTNRGPGYERQDDRDQAKVNAAHVAGLDPATVLNLLDAVYDDTGQPWRHRAERAEDRAQKERLLAAIAEHERDEARATIDRLEARLESANELGRAMTACCSKNAATIDRVRTLADEGITVDLFDSDHDNALVGAWVAEWISRVLAGDQETT